MTGQIDTLATPPPSAEELIDDPRTGEPRRPAVITVATASCWTAVAVVGASLLWVYWDAIFRFPEASWLMGQFETGPGSLERVLLAVAVTVIGLLIGVANAIVGYYAWTGYRWTRIAGLISAALTLGALTLNLLAWFAVPLALLGAGLLWLPRSRAFFDAWQTRRHPAPAFAPPVTDVAYGPLPKYR